MKKIILKKILKNHAVRVWTKVIWLMINYVLKEVLGHITLGQCVTWVILQDVNLLKPTSYVMHQQFNIQQLYALPTLYLCVLYLSENKQRLVLLT